MEENKVWAREKKLDSRSGRDNGKAGRTEQGGKGGEAKWNIRLCEE